MTKEQFALQLIPAVLHFGLEEGGGSAVAAMLDKSFWQGMVAHAHPEGVDFDWEDFSVEGIDYNPRLVAISFTFSRPSRAPEPVYGVILLAKQGEGAQYFTLELMETGHWAICTPDSNQPQVFSTHPTCLSLDEFLAEVAQLV